MIDPPPLPDYPAIAADEPVTLREFLDYQRAVMIRKVSGIDDEPLRRRMTPSGLSLLGIVKHLTDVERWWFEAVFAGVDATLTSSDQDPDADFRIEAAETTEAIVAAYRDAIDRSNEIASAASLEDLAARPNRRLGRHVSLRWIMVHMIEETARHAGHADLIREQLDGATGD